MEKPKVYVLVRSWNEALDVIDGKAITLDGIHGHIRVERPAKHVTRVIHYPSPRGKASEAYKDQKRKYRDDWMSDLTGSDRLVPIAYKLGVRFADDKQSEAEIQKWLRTSLRESR